MENKFDKNAIELISSFSNWPKERIQDTLQKHVYPGKQSWQGFLKLLFLSLGLGFCIAGIVFFFAYNWASLHKFAKLGLIECLLLAVGILLIIPKLNYLPKAILTTFLAILIGVLYSVFGQVYQTGANAYDFFFNWTLSIVLLVCLTQFASLWLLFFVLVHTTLFLYQQQVSLNWSLNIGLLIHYCLLILAYLFVNFYPTLVDKNYKISWLKHLLALALGLLGTAALCNLILASKPDYGLLLIPLALSYGAGIYQVFKEKKTLNLAIISLSILIAISVFIVDKTDINEGSLLFLCIFISVAVAFMSKYILTLTKQWSNENTN
ncbi:MAG: membrane-like protein [Bacteroidetes bacterium B1(2017)]|nr:MAG: membrane-like protein [Bacteroidetes bacterium B1(2017)]